MSCPKCSCPKCREAKGKGDRDEAKVNAFTKRGPPGIKKPAVMVGYSDSPLK